MPGYQGNLQAGMVQPAAMASWERFGVEFILTFIVVLTHCVSAERPRIAFGATSSPALAIGAVYGACTLVSVSIVFIFHYMQSQDLFHSQVKSVEYSLVH